MPEGAPRDCAIRPRRLVSPSERSWTLSGSEDYESALRSVARLSLPNFGAWSIVDVIERPDSMRRLAIIHPDPAKQELARALPSGWPPETEDPIGAPVAMRTRETYVIEEVTDEMLVEFARNEENLRALRELGMGSFVVVPLIVGDDVLGAVTFVSDSARVREEPARSSAGTRGNPGQRGQGGHGSAAVREPGPDQRLDPVVARPHRRPGRVRETDSLRRMSPEQKLAVMHALIRQAWELKAAVVRARQPELSEPEVRTRAWKLVGGDRP